MNNPTKDKKNSDYSRYSDYRVLRDGNWDNLPKDVRSSYRNFDDPTNQYDDLGFRIVRNK